MKNFAKFLAAMRSIAIIAMVAVIGFSMTACGGEEDDNGGNISWAGTWQKEGASDTFTLGANGVGYSFDSGPVSTANGRAWKTDDNYLYNGPALLFQLDNSSGTKYTDAAYFYDRISSTKIRIKSGTNSDNTRNGEWVKQ